MLGASTAWVTNNRLLWVCVGSVSACPPCNSPAEAKQRADSIPSWRQNFDWQGDALMWRYRQNKQAQLTEHLKPYRAFLPSGQGLFAHTECQSGNFKIPSIKKRLWREPLPVMQAHKSLLSLPFCDTQTLTQSIVQRCILELFMFMRLLSVVLNAKCR